MIEFTLTKDFSIIESVIVEEDWKIFDEKRSIATSEYYNFYYSYANSWKPKSILEIGVRRGYSAVSMLIGSGDSLERFVGIDSEVDLPSSSKFAQEIFRAHSNAEIKLINIDTQNSYIQDDIGIFDLIHIDADHTFHGCINDVLLALSLSKPGTKIIVDDCLYAPVRAAVEAVAKIYDTDLELKYVTNFRGHGLIQTLRSFPELANKEIRNQIINQQKSPFSVVNFSLIANNYSAIRTQAENFYTNNNNLSNDILNLIGQIINQTDSYLKDVVQKTKLTLNFYQDNGFCLDEIIQAVDLIESELLVNKDEVNYFFNRRFVGFVGKLQPEDVKLCKKVYTRLYLLNQFRIKLLASPVGKCFSYFCKSEKHFSYLATRISEGSNTFQFLEELPGIEKYSKSRAKNIVTNEGYLLVIILVDALINVLSNFESELEAQYWAKNQDKPKTEKLQLCPRKLEIGTVFDPATHYTEEYYNGAGLEYIMPDGTWNIYYGPAPTWEGFYLVLEILDGILDKEQGRKLLDIGCSFGDFVHKAVQRGWDAYGVDISSKAVKRANPDVRDRIICSDVNKPNEALDRQAPFDLITAWDFWEHIYESDLDQLMAGLFKLLRPGGVIFNIICTSAQAERDFVMNKGEMFTQENSLKLCSGHITIHKWHWWVKKFIEHGYVFDYDLAYLFQVARAEDENSNFANIVSWSSRNLLVLRKPE
ncbi:methyltransferase domain-containing protein [Hassallia byssoidea VB512170]|uniref:Methyltransferase domain-containing protein n=1 Tax=Hassallia byssoidea VB512170 TaxID=1304833 RepID=A0A846HBR3_9CYAN|nr:methyltransferase domain-containing protein [Hassalia byssoidea]NEU74134.1 methyltransferase domain-containing protein [Hassalia byssoidea VB512170]